MNKIWAAGVILSVCFAAHAEVKLGIDTLRDQQFKLLQKKRVGLVANPASVDSKLTPTVDVLRNAPGVKLVALYAPEHGIHGDVYAGKEFKDQKDERTGLPVYSVYGKTRKPTTQMVKDIDALVFDLQDIGSRSYTFVSSMKACMQSCAEHDKDFVVLDRPNPLGGVRIEGPGLTKPYESFIGYIYVPYVHGLTMGELAQYVQATELPKFKKLHVVKMTGWKREMLWQDTKLMWVPTSPNVPHAQTCAYYAATGFLGELNQLSHGIGFTMPFECAAAPWADADALAEAMNHHYNAPGVIYSALSHKQTPMNLPTVDPKGVFFRPFHYQPFYAAFKDELCHGVQVHLDVRNIDNLVEVNMRLMEALGAPQMFATATKARLRSWDITTGSDEARKYLMEMRDLAPLLEKWKKDCEAFREKRKPFLLYE